MTNAERTKLNNIAVEAYVNTIYSVAGKTKFAILTKDDANLEKISSCNRNSS